MTEDAPQIDAEEDLDDLVEVEIPEHLDEAGAAFYAAALEGFELSIPEGAALLQAAETLDVLADLRAALAETGRIVNGRPSPLLVELRQQRAILVRLLGLLDLSIDETTVPALSASRAASKAASARWAKSRSKGRFH